MSICFFSENTHFGKVARTFCNMRTEFAWQCSLNADHQNLGKINDNTYTTGVVILPKNWNYNIVDVVARIKDNCNKLAFMQEGANNYWHEWETDKQETYLKLLSQADALLCHNKSDINYYAGLLPTKNVLHLQSLMIEDAIPKETRLQLPDPIIGGNFTRWYGGADSYVIASQLGENVWAPTMGRRHDNERVINKKVQYLPFANWSNWMSTLSAFKYGVHLMREYAAGTFQLNCAYFGIPCIGYKNSSTQKEVELLRFQCTAAAIFSS